MNAGYCILFVVSCSLLFVDVSSDCDHYIDCFTEFLHEFFGNNNTRSAEKENFKNVTHKQYVLDGEQEDLDGIIKGLTGVIKKIDFGVKESETKREENEKTKIHVKIFEFNDDIVIAEEDTTEDIIVESTKGDDKFSETTTEIINFSELLLNEANMLPAETTPRNLNVIPIQNDKENEILNRDDFDDIFDDPVDDNSTDYPAIDYIELYKDTTNEDVEYIPTQPPVHLGQELTQKEKDIEHQIEESLNLIEDDVLRNLIKNITNKTIQSCSGDKMVLSEAVFPWVAAIFVKNDSKGNQFDYFCDGALISNKIVLTAARCVFNGTHAMNTEDFLIILGKTSLQVSSGGEKILKVKTIMLHENFTIAEGEALNDLALLLLEDSVETDSGIAAACLKNDEGITTEEDDFKEAVTTAWGFSGDLTLIYFDKEKSKACGQDNKVENTFCATYRNDVALCPSYGGVYATLSDDNQLYLRGLRSGNPLDRGICYSKDVTYTSLKNYRKWIKDIVDDNK
ncbi:unnamed protein product [Chilo suppressalis]|uniref:Peptidase S1 domain-containing protein n=1 Tax=Chilo suppressalis TaxID=168631 RepID=A0ABN8L4Q7_CHISP|nr:unnamed protein product [Chilo suppressalis]